MNATAVDFTNAHEKPPADASLFSRAAWWLADYAELWWSMGGLSEPDDEARCNEMAELARRLRELDGEWEAKRGAGTTKNAAEIVADMLTDWKLPGAVWWHAEKRRWRVTGEGYEPQDGEVCVGVYAPGVNPVLLQEDFEAADPPSPTA